MAFVEIVDIVQKREGRNLLESVNLQIPQGEVHALIGSTGAGKTTLLRIIALLDKPGSGRITIDDVDVSSSEKSRLALRRRMGFVLQKPVVFNASVYDNIAYGLKWRGMHKQQVHEKVESLLELAGMEAYRSRNARTLSGGEMQRVAIARAIAPDPEILLLDEPTANLDPLSAATIEELIEKIIKERNMTVIMSTHDMEQGQHLADRISVLDMGHVIQTGTPHDVFSYPVNRHVARFVGMENIIDGTVVACEGQMAVIEADGVQIEAVTECELGARVSACMRPEDITIAKEKFSSSARNALPGKVNWIQVSGPLCRVEIDCGVPLISLVTRRSAEEMGLGRGVEVVATFKVVSIHVVRSD